MNRYRARLRKLESKLGDGKLRPTIVCIPGPGHGSPSVSWNDGTSRPCDADEIEQLVEQGAQVLVGVDIDLVVGLKRPEAGP